MNEFERVSSFVAVEVDVLLLRETDRLSRKVLVSEASSLVVRVGENAVLLSLTSSV